MAPLPKRSGCLLSFFSSAYEMNDEIYMLYTGGDTFVMAATMKKADLVAALVPVGAADEPF